MSLSEKVLRFFLEFFFLGCHRRLDIFDPKKKEENKKKVKEQGQRFCREEGDRKVMGSAAPSVPSQNRRTVTLKDMVTAHNGNCMLNHVTWSPPPGRDTTVTWGEECRLKVVWVEVTQQNTISYPSYLLSIINKNPNS